MEGKPMKTNPNEMTPEELQELPGVGPSLAAKIQAMGPFQSLDEMMRVPGIGPALVERLREHVVFDDHAGEVTTEGEQEADSRPGESFRSNEKSEPPEMARQPAGDSAMRSSSFTATGRKSPSQPGRQVTWSQALQLAFLTGLLSVIFSAGLSLAVLAGINGTLDLDSHATVRQLSDDLTGVRSGLSQAVARQDSLVLRLEALEGLTGRVTAAESEIQAARGDLEAISAALGAMEGQVEQLQRDTEQLRRSAQRFDDFLQGLGELLGSLLGGADAGEGGATVTPVPTPGGG